MMRKKYLVLASLLTLIRLATLFFRIDSAWGEWNVSFTPAYYFSASATAILFIVALLAELCMLTGCATGKYEFSAACLGIDMLATLLSWILLSSLVDWLSLAFSLFLLVFLLLAGKRLFPRPVFPILCFCLGLISLIGSLFMAKNYGYYPVSAILSSVCRYLALAVLGLALPGREKAPAYAPPPIYASGVSYPPCPSYSPYPPPPSLSALLEEAARLRQAGLLTEEEYLKRKSDLLKKDG